MAIIETRLDGKGVYFYLSHKRLSYEETEVEPLRGIALQLEG